MSVKTSLRNAVAQLLYLAGVTAPRRRGRGNLSIVTFHRVLPAAERAAYPYPGLVVTPQELDAFLSYFSAHYDCATLAAQHARYLSGENPPRPLLAVTFDDGQHDNYQFARPVLAKHRMRATFFIPVAAVEQQLHLWHDRLGFAVMALLKHGPDGRDRLTQILAAAGLPDAGARNVVEHAVIESKVLDLDARLRFVAALESAGNAQIPEFARLMTYDEIALVAADGHEIGSHSMTHCMMPECDDSALAYELGESRRILQARTGLPIDSFCYPNGNADARTAAAVANAGYRRAVTTQWGRNRRDADRYRLNRCDMDAARAKDARGNVSASMVAFRMSGFYPGLG